MGGGWFSRGRRAWIWAVIFSFALFPLLWAGNLAAQTESPVDSLIQLSFSGLRLNRTTQTYDSLATLTNTSTTPISAPVYIVFYSFTPSSVYLYNATGTTPEGNRELAVNIPDGVLDPGETITNIVCKFKNPTNAQFTFSIQVERTMGQVFITIEGDIIIPS